jgi:hypothetical protein
MPGRGQPMLVSGQTTSSKLSRLISPTATDSRCARSNIACCTSGLLCILFKVSIALAAPAKIIAKYTAKKCSINLAGNLMLACLVIDMLLSSENQRIAATVAMKNWAGAGKSREHILDGSHNANYTHWYGNFPI